MCGVGQVAGGGTDTCTICPSHWRANGDAVDGARTACEICPSGWDSVANEQDACSACSAFLVWQAGDAPLSVPLKRVEELIDADVLQVAGTEVFCKLRGKRRETNPADRKAVVTEIGEAMDEGTRTKGAVRPTNAPSSDAQAAMARMAESNTKMMEKLQENQNKTMEKIMDGQSQQHLRMAEQQQAS